MMHCSTVLRAQAAARVPFVCSPLSGARLVFTMLQVQQIIRATGEMPPERLDCKWAPKFAAKTLVGPRALLRSGLCDVKGRRWDVGSCTGLLPPSVGSDAPRDLPNVSAACDGVVIEPINYPLRAYA